MLCRQSEAKSRDNDNDGIIDEIAEIYPARLFCVIIKASKPEKSMKIKFIIRATQKNLRNN